MDTKILSYLSIGDDEALIMHTEHVRIIEYDKLLKNSISIGYNWLCSHVFSSTTLKGNPSLHAESLKKKLLEYGVIDITLNQFIIDMCRKWESYLKMPRDESILEYFSKPPPKSKRKSIQVCDINDPPIENIVKDDYLLVEVAPGRFHKFVYIKHDDHYDYLPMWYVLDKYPKLLGLLVNNKLDFD